MKERFSNGKTCINAKTVGDIIDELSLLPRDLQVKEWPSESLDIILFNASSPDPHVSFDEGGEWDDEAAEDLDPWEVLVS